MAEEKMSKLQGIIERLKEEKQELEAKITMRNFYQPMFWGAAGASVLWLTAILIF